MSNQTVKTKQIHTKEIHETPDEHMYVMCTSTKLEQFVHWKKISSRLGINICDYRHPSK